jgi:stage II sporulation protein D
MGLLWVWILCAGFGSAYAQTEVGADKNQIRVALALDQTTDGFYVVQGQYEIRDLVTGQAVGVMPGFGQWSVSPIGTGSLYVDFNGSKVQGLGGSGIWLRQINTAELALFKYRERQYRGDLLLINQNGKLQVVNVLDLEQYLYGVVPKEIGASGIPSEAYKAQAVASRTYACYSKNAARIYDVGITESSQVYGGYDGEASAASLAVDQTRGQVIYYDQQIIQAVFSSNAGGHTEAAENVWNEPLAYLQPVSSPEDNCVISWAQSSENWPGNTYQWEKTFSASDMEQLISDWNGSHPDQGIHIGDFVELKAYAVRMHPQTKQWTTEATQSGRVTRIDFVGTTGTKGFYREQIRTVLGLKSTLFEIAGALDMPVMTAESASIRLNVFQSYAVDAAGAAFLVGENQGSFHVLGTNGIKEIKPGDTSQIVISGKGNGHGVGMSQWGAIGMAQKGSDYRQIIEHYYNQSLNNGRLTIGAWS